MHSRNAKFSLPSRSISSSYDSNTPNHRSGTSRRNCLHRSRHSFAVDRASSTASHASASRFDRSASNSSNFISARARARCSSRSKRHERLRRLERARSRTRIRPRVLPPRLFSPSPSLPRRERLERALERFVLLDVELARRRRALGARNPNALDELAQIFCNVRRL